MSNYQNFLYVYDVIDTEKIYKEFVHLLVYISDEQQDHSNYICLYLYMSSYNNRRKCNVNLT